MRIGVFDQSDFPAYQLSRSLPLLLSPKPPFLNKILTRLVQFSLYLAHCHHGGCRGSPLRLVSMAFPPQFVCIPRVIYIRPSFPFPPTFSIHPFFPLCEIIFFTFSFHPFFFYNTFCYITVRCRYGTLPPHFFSPVPLSLRVTHNRLFFLHICKVSLP